MEEHPRHETEEKRRYARKRLRSTAEQLLKSHGQPSPVLPIMDLGVESEDVSVRFEDGSWASLVSLEKKIIIINVYKTEDPLGPLTQYRSWSPGEFDRYDVNPQDSGADSTELAEREGPMAMLSNIAVGSLGGALDMTVNSQEGIDGNPITAQEARDLRDQLKTATPIPFR
jgi:hypothetical protein